MQANAAEVLGAFAIVAARVTIWLLLAFAAAGLLRRAAAGVRRQLFAAALTGVLVLTAAGFALAPVKLRVLPAPTAPVAETMPPRLPPALDDEGRLEAIPLTPPPGEVDRRAAELGLALPTPAASTETRSLFAPVVLGIYLIGLGLALARVVGARLRTARLVGRARAGVSQWPTPNGIEVRESDAIALPMTVGTWWPVVLVPSAGRSWPADWRAAVLAHEVAHVRARDPLWQFVAELAMALHWFNPLVYLAARQLRTERELAADDAALARGARPSEYANVLFELACEPDTEPPRGAVVPLLTPAGLKARLLGVLDPKRRRHVGRTTGWALGTVVVAALAPVALALPAARHPADARVRPGEIIGRVVDDASDQPVAGAEVVFRFPGPVNMRTAAVTSDSNGWFVYPEDEPVRLDFDVYARQGTQAARKHILAIPYGTSLPVALELRPAHKITGQVNDPAGRPIADATVRFLERSRTTPPPGRQTVARSDAAGRFKVDGVLYGEFKLLVQAPWGVATLRTVVVDDKDLFVDVVVAKDWPVTGRLEDEEGRPLAGVRVQHGSMSLHRGGNMPPEIVPLPGQRYLDWDETAADGSFRLLRRGGTLGVTANAQSGQMLVARFEDGGERLQVVSNVVGEGWQKGWHRVRRPEDPGPTVVRMRPAVKVSGVVLAADGKPAAGAYVWAHATPEFQQQFAIADAEGRFSIDGLPSQPSRLTATAANLSGGRGEVALPLESGHKRSNIVIHLPATPAATLSP
jgi:BlaR1 peptidase M56/Carboxypeptidase regulatory-like domain